MTCGDKFISIIFFRALSIVDSASGMLANFCILMIMLCFLGKKGTITKKSFLPGLFYLFGVIIIVFLLTTYDFFMLKNSWNEPYIDGLVPLSNENLWANMAGNILTIVIFISAFFTFKKHRILNSILACVLSYALIYYLMLETAYTATFLSPKPRETLNIILHLKENLNYFYAFVCIVSSFFVTLISFLALYYGMIKKNRTMPFGWKLRILLLLWEAFSICILIFPLQENVSDSQYTTYLGYEIGILMPFMSVVIPFLFLTITSRQYAVKKALIQEDYLTAELNYINQYKKNQDETRAFRHDIINNLSMLSMMLNDHNYGDARNYLDTLLGNVKAITPKFITGDEMLDCIVGMKSSKMEEIGIEFSLDGVVDGGFGMKPVDVCSIFANAIDNAIEACEKLPKDSKKWIQLSIKKTDQFFQVKLKNTMPSDEAPQIASKLFNDSERITTKKDSILHGYGAQNMKAAISKYDGIEKAEATDGVFTLSIMIPRSA